MSSRQGKAPGSTGAQSKSGRPIAEAKHSLKQQGDVPRDENYNYEMDERVHKISERLRKELDGLCVPVYTIIDRGHTEQGHFEEYKLAPVYNGHGMTEWQLRSNIEVIPTPECTAKRHTHCGETSQTKGQETQKASSSAGGSEPRKGKHGDTASRNYQKAPMPPQDENSNPRYSSFDCPPPYDTLMTD